MRQRRIQIKALSKKQADYKSKSRLGLHGPILPQIQGHGRFSPPFPMPDLSSKFKLLRCLPLFLLNLEV
jgi:hypothetical protein